ncbi:hypothetical protein EXIGLDRAFT_747834 [Exidia glandulosa HHB12029]|uniref:Fungal N-terminal domain-containing protein n=1 Tax=Exidia glandulosa HHB12029 TaxID=1314781 RepID=A0A165KC49_EXIGL|nr:hypothetical protein EXIGLDRAFT_747834 [Exidia glandulosa HHB12029]
MFPVTFNAIGDMIALLQVGLDIIKRLDSIRGARAEYRQLADELQALKPILLLYSRAIEALPDIDSRDLVLQPIASAYQDIGHALCLLANFDPLGLSVLPRATRGRSRLRVVWSSLQWSLRGSADVKAGLEKLQKSVDRLKLALIPASVVNNAVEFRAMTQSLDKLALDVSSIDACTATILEDSSVVKADVHAIAADVSTIAADATTQTVMSRAIYDQLKELRLEHDEMMALLQRRSACTIVRFEIPDYYGMTLAITSVLKGSTGLLSSSSDLLSGSVVGSLLTLAARASSFREQAAYLLGACLVLLGTRMVTLYKAPSVIHIVFVVDFFGDILELRPEEASSSEVLQRTLELRLRGRFGFNITRRRMYEIALSDDGRTPGQVLPSVWSHSITPGQKLLLNACVRDSGMEKRIACPACGTSLSKKVIRADAWVKCIRCPTVLDFSPLYRHGTELEDELDRPIDPLEASESHYGTDAGDVPGCIALGLPSVEEELARCQRIRSLAIIARYANNPWSRVRSVHLLRTLHP